jgi:hypothetical protein
VKVKKRVEIPTSSLTARTRLRWFEIGMSSSGAVTFVVNDFVVIIADDERATESRVRDGARSDNYLKSWANLLSFVAEERQFHMSGTPARYGLNVDLKCADLHPAILAHG